MIEEDRSDVQTPTSSRVFSGGAVVGDDLGTSERVVVSQLTRHFPWDCAAAVCGTSTDTFALIAVHVYALPHGFEQSAGAAGELAS